MSDNAKLNESVGAVAATVTSTGGVAPSFRRAPRDRRR